MIRKAVILAAGRGTRMEGLTEDRPKPMIEVGGKPLLEHILDRLRAAGFSDALVVTGYKAEMIENHFAGYPMRIEFRRQQEVNGTARASLLAREFIAGDSFLLTYGDVLITEADYRAMVTRVEGDHQAVGGLAVKWVDDPWQGAAVYEEDGRVARIIEKPVPGTSATHWNSAGCYIFPSAIFDEFARVPLSARGEYELTSGVAQLVESGARLLLCPLEGGWRDVGRPGDLEAAQRLV